MNNTNKQFSVPLEIEKIKREEKGIGLSSTKLNVDAVLDQFLDKYAPDNQKIPKGKGRGAVVPVGATGATMVAEMGIKIADAAKDKVEPVAKIAGAIGVGGGAAAAAMGIIEKAASLMPIITAVPGPIIAGTTSAVSSEAVSLFQRVMGENAFKLFAKYSHTEEGSWLGDLVSKVNPVAGFAINKVDLVGKNLTRGAERAVLELKEMGGVIEMNDQVKRFIKESEKTDFYQNADRQELLGEGFYYVLAAKATDKLGAYYTPEEKVQIAENVAKVTNALERVINNPELYKDKDPQVILDALSESVDRLEKWNWLKSSVAIAGISGVKSALMYKLIELAAEALDGLKNAIPAFRKADKTSSNPTLQSEVVPVPVPGKQPKMQPAVEPIPVESPAPVFHPQPSTQPDVIPEIAPPDLSFAQTNHLPNEQATNQVPATVPEVLPQMSPALKLGQPPESVIKATLPLGGSTTVSSEIYSLTPEVINQIRTISGTLPKEQADIVIRQILGNSEYTPTQMEELTRSVREFLYNPNPEDIAKLTTLVSLPVLVKIIMSITKCAGGVYMGNPAYCTP
jgi:hypothetical protein